MRRITALLLMLLLLPGLVAAEDDFDLDDILSDADPDVVKNTYSQPGNADDILLDENNEPVSIYEEDGSILITLTATGDFTVGGDSRKSTSIWMNELKKHDNDYNFALANVRDIFLADDLTIVNFEGTLTDSTYVPSEKRNNEFLFSASPDHVSMLWTTASKRLRWRTTTFLTTVRRSTRKRSSTLKTRASCGQTARTSA